MPDAARAVVVSLDGVMAPMRGGYREAGCTTASLVDADGERLHSVRMGRMAESHKATLKTMVAAEVEVVLAKRPDLTLVKLADGTKDNWTFLARALPDGVKLISNVQFRSHTLSDRLPGAMRASLGPSATGWMDAALFAAAASVLVLPAGAAGGLVLLACSVAYLTRDWSVPRRNPLHLRELLFIGALLSYPVLAALNVFALVEPVRWRYFDDPSRFLMAIPIYVALRRARSPPAAFVQGSILGVAGAGLLAGYQFFVLENPRPGGFMNPVSFSNIALLLICISLMPVELPRTWRRLRVAAVVLGGVAVVLANSRGAFLAVPILALAISPWFYSRRPRLKKWVVLVPVTFMGILLLIPHTQQRIVQATAAELTSLREPGGSLTSVSERLERMKAAWLMFEKHPWFGVGHGQYFSELRKLNREGLVGDIAASGTHAHNNYLHLAAEMGAAGLAVYLLLLLCIFETGRYCRRRGVDNVGVMLMAFAIGQGIFSLTDTQFSINITCTFFAMASAVLVALAFNAIERDRPEHRAGRSATVCNRSLGLRQREGNGGRYSESD